MFFVLLLPQLTSNSIKVIWTNRLSTDYALFIALAILDKETEKICHPDNDFSDILKVR